MPFDDIDEFEKEFSEGKLKIRIVELENGLLILLSDSEKYRMGHSAAAIPPSHTRPQPTSTGLFSTGPDSVLVRTLAERVADITKQMVMIVAGVQDLNPNTMIELMQLLKNHFVQ
ncbi:hypothetical protein EU537_06310 [Candidatus Thorarchaeota archaeon]|nr:MAG: hypothetical protein EU537_06310 [Candidatus Thorarchaeota archaeon]